MYLLLSQLWHLNQRAYALLVLQKTQGNSSSMGSSGEAFGGGDGHKSDNWFPFIYLSSLLISVLCYFLVLRCLFLHMNYISFHLSFFQNFNLGQGLSFIYLLNAWHSKALIPAGPSGKLNFNCCLQDASLERSPL